MRLKLTARYQHGGSTSKSSAHWVLVRVLVALLSVSALLTDWENSGRTFGSFTHVREVPGSVLAFHAIL